MANQQWKTALIVLVSVMAGVFLAGSMLLPVAQGQSEGRAAGVVCVMGEQRNGYAPIVVLDVPEQTALVYQYSYGNGRLELVSARTYRFDRLLTEFNVDGPSVEQVQKQVAPGR